MADKPKADSKPKGPDFNAIAKKLQEHAEGDHIDDLTEKLSDVFSSYKKSIGNKRKLDENQTVELGNKLYDALRDHLTESYYGIKPDDAKSLHKIKGKHGDSLLDNIVDQTFDIDRQQLINGLHKHRESGKSFSYKALMQMLNKSIDRYNGTIQNKIIGELNDTKHISSIKEQISQYIKNHKLKEKEFKPILESNNLGDLIGTYAQLATNYYQPPAEPPKK